jgi:hypothetical protein
MLYSMPVRCHDTCFKKQAAYPSGKGCEAPSLKVLDTEYARLDTSKKYVV